ncbi:MAG: C10 family peptidase [Candidatus Cloacimonadota bacterium]|nr:C10 family peptidase [Candidatus Cloacimonadota bacterium]
MKKTILLLFVLLNSILFLSSKVNLHNAERAVQTFLQSKQIEQKIVSRRFNQTDNYYVFDLSEKGFVISSNEENIQPIIAYSIKHSLNNNEGFLNMVNDDMKLRKKYYQSNLNFENQNKWEQLISGNYQVQRDFQQWPAPNSTYTDGWVEATWNQSGIYNQFCPMDGNSRSVVGCVATAAAMIVDFHKYVGEPNFNSSDSYWSGYSIHIDNDHDNLDFPSFEELTEYLQVLDTHYETNANITNQDKAALSFACGVMVEMGYSASGSGAWTAAVPSALQNKFGFDSGYWQEEGYGFYDDLAEQMMYMRPAPMSIYDSNWEGGHAIICDGYNTDDFYHLNYGWGTSNGTCWYSLPQGMPSGYSIITGAGMNIEGGQVPIEVEGIVNGSSDPTGTFVTFEGASPASFTITEEDGTFEISALLPGMYTVTAIQGRVLYQSFDLFISETNNYIEFELGEYDEFTGIIVADCELDDVYITLYDSENVFIDEYQTDETGTFSFANILPGNYHLVASKQGGYFGINDFELDLEHQSTDIIIEEYGGNSVFTYSKYATEKFSIEQEFELTCAIKMNEEIENHIDSAISGVTFKSPISSEDGELFAQVWENDILISEKEVTDLIDGEWRVIEFDNYCEIKSGYNYYVGYKIHTIDGDVAFHDAGPKVGNKSTFIRTTGWTYLNSSYDFNFCIEANILNNNFGTVSGSISSAEIASLDFANTVIRAGNYISHPDVNGNYSIQLSPGTYTIEASSPQFPENISDEIIVEAEEDIEYNFDITPIVDNVISPNQDRLIGNFPNPFNPSTTIEFEVENKTQAKLTIFNIKGQTIKTLIDKKIDSGIHSIEWNGTDNSEKLVSSGFYLYVLETSNNVIVKKALLLK